MSEGIWVPPGGSADPGRREEEQQQQPRQPTEQELADQLRAELQRMKVSDLLVQTLYTVSSLGYHKLAPESRDLEQARLAIEALRALLPVLRGAVPDEVSRDFAQVVANMQLAYADAAGQGAPADESPAEPPEEAPSDAPKPDEADLESVDEEELGGGG